MKMLFIRTALMLTALSTFSAINAAPPADPLRVEVLSKQERELQTQIDRFITYPLLERKPNMDGNVEVSFVINTAGKVEVMSAMSGNDDLLAYVLRKLNKVDIGENPSGTWKVEHVRFVFRPEA